MIDLHSHILPNVDDGSQGIEETFNLIKEAKNAGFKAIVSTSHYYRGKYEVDEAERLAWINAIRQNLKNIVPEMQIYLGSEIYISSKIVDLIKERKASVINGTRYVLFELPFSKKPENLKDVIFSLISEGYKPILAHPERYDFVKEKPNELIDLINMGVLLQSNYASLIGLYGKRAEKTARLLIKNNFIHFLGSDVHKQNTIYVNMKKILKELNNLIPKEEVAELTSINAKYVLENEDVDIRNPIKIKTGFLGKWL